ncbi:protein argonaute-2-like [Homalodisca vitripennis]|uniref:protein argonaute-2-like n=1 Tax=Homalodisca vitripennis TaxID=197043 RepID=UPI001EEC70DC|nr:protein argonaute-2-like [Homalodisca vitripennis]
MGKKGKKGGGGGNKDKPPPDTPQQQGQPQPQQQGQPRPQQQGQPQPQQQEQPRPQQQWQPRPQQQGQPWPQQQGQPQPQQQWQPRPQQQGQPQTKEHSVGPGGDFSGPGGSSRSNQDQGRQWGPQGGQGYQGHTGAMGPSPPGSIYSDDGQSGGWRGRGRGDRGGRGRGGGPRGPDRQQPSQYTQPPPQGAMGPSPPGSIYSDDGQSGGWRGRGRGDRGGRGRGGGPRGPDRQQPSQYTQPPPQGAMGPSPPGSIYSDDGQSGGWRGRGRGDRGGRGRGGGPRGPDRQQPSQYTQPPPQGGPGLLSQPPQQQFSGPPPSVQQQFSGPPPSVQQQPARPPPSEEQQPARPPVQELDGSDVSSDSSSIGQVTSGVAALKVSSSGNGSKGLWPIPERTKLADKNNMVGTRGRVIEIEVNHLLLTLKKTTQACHYDCDFKPDAPKKLFRPAIREMQRKHFPNRYPAFDGRKNLYSSGELPFGKVIRDTVSVSDPERKEPKEFDVTIKFTNYVDMSQISKYFSQRMDFPQEAAQVLDIVLRSPAAMNFTPVGRSFFTPPKNQIISLGNGLELWYGFYQSSALGWRPFLNVDGMYCGVHPVTMRTLSSPLQQPATAVSLAPPTPPPDSAVPPASRAPAFSTPGPDIMPPGSENEFTRVEKKEEKPGTGLLGGVEGSQPPPPGSCSVLIAGANDIGASRCKGSVLLDFNTIGRRHFTRHGQHLTMRGKWLLAELVVVGLKKASLVTAGRSPSPPPPSLQKSSLPPPPPPSPPLFVITENGFNKDNVCKTPVAIAAVALSDTPNLSLIKDVVVNVERICVDEEGNKTPTSHSTSGDADGGMMSGPGVEKAGARDAGGTAESGGGVGGASDTAVAGCCSGDDSVRMVTGCTPLHVFITFSPHLMDSPTMLVGADVTHPSPDQTTIPSVAAVAASHDRRAFQYNMIWKLQEPKLEIIEKMQEIMVEQLKFFYRSTKQKPQKIIFYRDGVSDGHFSEVLNSELSAIRAACRSLQSDGSYKPSVTFLVVQKRHHTRFFPTRREDEDGKNKNVPPGTIVDTMITHPREMDFYLVSHASLQGTSRPTKYHKLWDDSNISEDDLEELTYYLCHLFTRCTRSVSYPAPTYYAHLAAARGRVYLEGQQVNLSSLEQEMRIRTIKDSIVRESPMFFV